MRLQRNINKELLIGVMKRSWIGVPILLFVIIFQVTYFHTLENQIIKQTNELGKSHLAMFDYVVDSAYDEYYTTLKNVLNAEELPVYLEDDSSFNRDNAALMFQRVSYNTEAIRTLRYIDAHGNEIIRINSTNDEAIIVPEGQLESKIGKECIDQSLTLSEGEMYSSSLLFHTENNITVDPLEYVLKLSIPVFFKGEPRGFLMISFAADRILDLLNDFVEEFPSDLKYGILENDGGWIIKQTDDQLEYLIGQDNKFTGFSAISSSALPLMNSGDYSLEELNDTTYISKGNNPLQSQVHLVKEHEWVLMSFYDSKEVLSHHINFTNINIILHLFYLVLFFFWVDRNRRNCIHDLDRISLKKTKGILSKQLAGEQLLLDLSNWAIGVKDINDFLETCINDTGRVLDMSRCYIFEVDDEKQIMNNTHEWCMPGVTSEITGLKDLPLDRYAWWMDHLKRNEAICYSDFSELSDAETVAFLRKQQIYSIYVLPILVNQRLWGFIGVDECRYEKRWTDHETYFLGTLTQLLAKTIEGYVNKRELVRQRDLYELTLASVSSGIVVTDQEGIILEINPEMEVMYGDCSSDMIGKLFGEVVRFRPIVCYDELEDHVESVLKTGDVIYLNNHLLDVDDERSLYVTAIISPMFEDEELKGTVTIIQDVSAQIREQQQVNQMAKMESLSVLAGGIAHDFNNLLNGIFGYIQLAELSQDSPEDCTAYLNHAMEVFDDTKNLTQQLLTFAKGGNLEIKEQQIKSVIKESVVFALAGTQVSQSMKIDEDLFDCAFDKGQIKQTLNNLIINAIQAIDDDGIIEILAMNEILTSEIHGLKGGPYIHIAISDNGVGIPEDALSRIFDPFYTTKKSGSGIGLASCYSIIEQHNGALTVESQVGVGTTFHVYLPAITNKVSPVDTATLKDFSGEGSILILDDGEHNMRILTKMFESLGFDVLPFYNGHDLLEACEGFTGIKAAFFDLTIPGGMAGLETLKRLAPVDYPVFAVSGYSTNNVMIDPEAYGFKGALRKPYTKGNLVLLLQEIFID